mmetsp:Transcript_51980/g.123753  ORF Transcript_51980/g.123753 Transcript_51980/m.123753 type:complete len:223 (-) Transcript_51980:87-755(-)
MGITTCLPCLPSLANARQVGHVKATVPLSELRTRSEEQSIEENSNYAKAALKTEESAVQFAVGDVVVLRKSAGIPSEFHSKVAIISDMKPTHCTVYLLNDDCSQGMAELWPGYHDLQLINKLCRIGSKVKCSGIPKGPGAYLNNLSATVQEHPKDGHPQWPDSRGELQKGGRLFVFIVPDDHKKRPMSVPIRYLRSLHEASDNEEQHVATLLRIASSVAPTA